jgi:hypothetical protein
MPCTSSTKIRPDSRGSSPAMTHEKSFSRHLLVPEPCRPRPCKSTRPRQKREAKRRKEQCHHCRATPISVAASRCLGRGCAPFSEARPPSGASTAALAGTPVPAQLQAMLPATWNEAGVTRPILSQSSDSTSRLGRNRNDAQSRSGADCESARKHRTRSTLRIASGMRPSNERDLAYVT